MDKTWSKKEKWSKGYVKVVRSFTKFVENNLRNVILDVHEQIV